MTILNDSLLSGPPLLQAMSTVEEALVALHGARHGVVVTETGIVLAVITAEDLARARELGARHLADPQAALPPGVVLRSGTTLAALAGDDAITLLDLVPDGSAAAVTDDEDRLLGLFPLDVLDRYLAEGGEVAEKDVLGAAGYDHDGQAMGQIRLGLARVVCAECGYINELLPPVDLTELGQCTNPNDIAHRLTIARAGSDG